MKIYQELSKTADNNGKQQVMIRLVITRTNRPRLKSGVFVSPEFFREKEGKVVAPRRSKLNAAKVIEAESAIMKLDTFCCKITNIVNVNPYPETVTKDWLQRVMELEDQKLLTISPSMTMVDIADAERKRVSLQKIVSDKRDMTGLDLFALIEQCNILKTNGKGKMYTYRNLSGLLHRYLRFVQQTRNKHYELRADTFTPEDLEDFNSYALSEGDLAKKYPEIFAEILKEFPYGNGKRALENHSKNYMNTELNALKTVFIWLNKSGRCSNQPFNGFKIPAAVYGEPMYLTAEERNALSIFPLEGENAKLEMARDVFIFQSLVGCRYSDLAQMTASNICDNILIYEPIKTQEHGERQLVNVPLKQQALDLIKKYEGADALGRLFPIILLHNYNKNIHDLFKVAGLDRNVVVRDRKTRRSVVKPLWEVASSHMARRNFIGAAYQVVQDPDLISAMTGHVPGSNSFRRYRKVNNEMLRNIIDKM